MIKLAMVRHGQTNYNLNHKVQGRINIPLNENGRKQALDLALHLKEMDASFDAILSSPLSRAMETAMIIKNTLDHSEPLHIIQPFIERHFGFLDGEDVDKGRDYVRARKYSEPDFENDEDLINRIVYQAYQLLKNYDNQNLLCVAHSHVIKAMLVYVDPKQNSFADYVLDNGDIVYFEIDEKQIRLINHQKNPKRA